MRVPARLGGALLALVAGTAGAVACWKPSPAPGALGFEATQAGAPFTGVFREYEGDICLDPSMPGGGRIDVRVRTASVESGLPEMDEALRGDLFFNSAKWPDATFSSSGIRALGDGRYRVTGEFTLRDITREITVPFTFAPATDSSPALLRGETTIQRLDYDVGLGEWRDTRWVGNEVILKFAVPLAPGES